LGATEKQTFFRLCESVVPEWAMVHMKNEIYKISNSKIKRRKRVVFV